MRELLAISPLEASAFRPTGMVLGGVASSDGRELCELLGVSVPSDDAGETSIRAEGGPSLKMHLHPDKIRVSTEDSVNGTGEKGRSASEAHSPRYVGCIQDSRPRIERVSAHDRDQLDAFLKNLKAGVKLEDMDDELKSWWLNGY